MKTIFFDRIGSPLDVLQLGEAPVPEVGPGQVLVRMVSASINPGDFLFIQGLYPDPKKPHLPKQIAGSHGAGFVAKVGAGVELEVGTLVAFSYENAWAEYVALPEAWLIPLPAGYPVEKAAQFVNLITAWDLLERAAVKPGEWLALTAGHSTVATMVAQMAKRRSIHVLSIVRHSQTSLDLETFGSSAVIELSNLRGDIGERIQEITKSKGIAAVVDCVGGRLTGDLIRAVSFGGKVIFYGGFHPERFELHNFDILMKGIELSAYVYRYFFEPPRRADFEELAKLASLAGDTNFKVRIGATHALDDFREAVRETWEHAERGKRFFVMPVTPSQIPRLPHGFEGRRIATPDANLFVQVGGAGSPVVLLHGHVETGDMWGPLAAELSKRHTVIVPDLRGLGRSSRPIGGYDKKTQARDIRAIVEELGFDQAAIVAHDIGGTLAYAYAARYPTKVNRLVFMEAPVPGVGPWAEVCAMPALWHWNFGGPDAERLVHGRERIYFDRFWNEFAADPSKISDAAREHYAAFYAAKDGMRASFAHFAAFAQDARDNAITARTLLAMPVLAIGAERAFGAYPAAFMRSVASHVREVLIPDVGHWLMEEAPEVIVPLVRDFLDGRWD